LRLAGAGGDVGTLNHLNHISRMFGGRHRWRAVLQAVEQIVPEL
jgi:hypothetical protein